MKRLVIGAVLAVSALVSGTAAADVLQCQRTDGTQQRIYASSTAMQIGNVIYTFAKTGTLDDGTEVYVFKGNKDGKMMVMASSTDGVVYQVVNANRQVIDEGVCK